MITVPNIVAIQEFKFAGALPTSLQNVTTYTGALSATAGRPAAANALLHYPTSADATAAFVASGLQRPKP